MAADSLAPYITKFSAAMVGTQINRAWQGLTNQFSTQPILECDKTGLDSS